MDQLTEKTQEQSSEYTVIGNFIVPAANGEDACISVRDYSSDGSGITMVASIHAVDDEWSFNKKEYEMHIDSPQHGTAVTYNLIGHFGKIDDDWFKEFGWTEKEED